MRLKALNLLMGLLALWLGVSCGAALSFPQYEEWISKKAGFQADCSYCHMNRDGPTGSEPGQLGALTDAELELVHTKDSPILNTFGQSLIEHLGYPAVLKGLADPAQVAEKMKNYDHDGDGVTDGIEMEHGTLANDPLSAPPSLIWQKRLVQHSRFVTFVALAGLVGAVGLFGLSRSLGGTRETG